MMIKRVYTLKALLTVLGTLLVLNVSCYYTYMVCIVKDRMCGNTLVYHRILSYTQGSTMQGSTRKLPAPFIPMFLHYLGLLSIYTIKYLYYLLSFHKETSGFFSQIDLGLNLRILETTSQILQL